MHFHYFKALPFHSKTLSIFVCLQENWGLYQMLMFVGTSLDWERSKSNDITQKIWQFNKTFCLVFLHPLNQLLFVFRVFFKNILIKTIPKRYRPFSLINRSLSAISANLFALISILIMPYKPMFQFYTPWKDQKTSFSGCKNETFI